MKYLRKYNETVDSNSELANLVLLNLEDNGLFEVEDITLETNKQLLLMNINYTDTNDTKIIELRKDVLETTQTYEDGIVDYELYEIYDKNLKKYEDHLRNITTTLLNKVLNKYDFYIPKYSYVDFTELSVHNRNHTLYFYQCTIKKQ